MAGPWRELTEPRLLFDLTYVDSNGELVREQEIFDCLLELINRAQTFLVLDFFLLNDYTTSKDPPFRALSGELVERLVRKREQVPECPVLLITDPINTVYGSEFHQGLIALTEAGVAVVGTDLIQLRDSNPLYSVFYRLVFRWLRNRRGGGWLPNPFLPGDTVTLRSWLSLLNFKANHRKVAIAGVGEEEAEAFVTSANPHDASSAHSNIGLRFAGEAAWDLLEGELAIARFSDWPGGVAERTERAVDADQPPVGAGRVEPSIPALRVVTEGAIRDGLLEALALAGVGDRIELAMFYLGHRAIVRAVLSAASQGALVRLVLDPNRDAFGLKKDGVPNRPVARELLTKSRGQIEIRWYQTHGEQFHTKLALVRTTDLVWASLGSANLTRRNLDDLNLEANVELRLAPTSALAQELDDYFSRLWNNHNGVYTADYDAMADRSRWRYWKYRVMEATGLSTF